MADQAYPPNAPLRGIKVLDLSRVLAGPYAAQLLADLGAEVVKVEKPSGGDDARFYGPPFLPHADGQASDAPMFVSANRNKRGVAIDIAKPAGQDIVRGMAAGCDVVIENFKVGDLQRYRLDYAAVRELNPGVVYCSITGFGQTGPYRKRPGYDPIAQALGGLMSTTGLPDGVPGGGPMKVGPSIVDIITGLFAANAIQAALLGRAANGGAGSQIDVSLLDCCIAAMSHHAQHYLMSGKVPLRLGTAGNGGAPTGRFSCKDGDIVIAPGNNVLFARLCETLGHPELVDDPRFKTVALRIANRNVIEPMIQDFFSEYETDDLYEKLQAAGIPAGKVNDLQQVFADRHVQERGMARTVQHSSAGPLKLVANPLRFDGLAVEDYTAPPRIGEHSREVLRDLAGLDDAAFDALQAEGVVAEFSAIARG